ncbi:MAG: hypothetical protein V3575_06445 [Candidatus Absconditabacteria bacterium]
MKSLLIKTFIKIQNASFSYFLKQKLLFFVFGLLILLCFELLIGFIIGMVFNFFINFIPGGYLFSPKILALILMVVFFTIMILSFITSIPTLYLNKEVKYLLSGPFSYKDIFSLGFFKVSYFGLLGSLFILIPTFVAYGIVNNYGIWFVFYGLFSLFFLTFFACLIGVFLSLIFIRFFLSLKILLRNSLFLVTFFSFVYYIVNKSIEISAINKQETFTFIEDKILGYDYSNILLPFNRFSKLLDYILISDYLAVSVYVIFIILTSIISTILLIKLGDKLYFQSLQNIWGFNLFNKKPAIKYKSLFIQNKTLNILIKDILITFRDPSQWSQLIIFFVLLTMYIFAIKGVVVKNVENVYIISVLSLVNTGLAAFFVGAISLRFIFPNISLEGKSLWILKTIPLKGFNIYVTKSIFFTILLLITGYFLSYFYGNIIGFSSVIKLLGYSLLLPLLLTIISIFYVMGTFYPDFKETNPSKISTSIPGFLSIFLGNILLIIILFTIYPKVLSYYKSVKNCTAPIDTLFYSNIIFVWFICTFIIGFLLYIGYNRYKSLEV